MTQNDITSIAKAQLATDLNCSIHDMDGEKDSIVFCSYRQNPGRRPFPRDGGSFEILYMGGPIIVSATNNVMDIMKPQLAGKDRDTLFSMPFINGLNMYYLPDLSVIEPLSAPRGFDYEMVEQSRIPRLYKTDGFRNAISYDINNPRPDTLVVLAKCGGNVAGMAGASIDCEMLWQVGIDVLEQYRRHGLAAYLVNKLTIEILQRGKVPYYGTSSSNIASQRVAHRAGYLPAWICAYRSNVTNPQALYFPV